MDMQRREIEINSIMTVDTGYGFKTAQITLESDTVLRGGAFIIPKDLFGTGNPEIGLIMPAETTLPAGTYQLVLYKGKGIMFVEGVDVSGSAEEVDTDAWLVTGDCTVTIPEDDDLGDLG